MKKLLYFNFIFCTLLPTKPTKKNIPLTIKKGSYIDSQKTVSSYSPESAILALLTLDRGEKKPTL